MTKKVTLAINGVSKQVEVSPDKVLLELLRDDLHLTGTKQSCDRKGQCGACTVIIDGKATRSCLKKVVNLEGANVITVEGLGTPENPHMIQEAYVLTGVIQCGYCTPGMIMATKALLDKNPNPTLDEIKKALASHPDVNMISFTGSCETGKRIMELASATVKHLGLELGGKNPFIVMEDADLDKVIPKAVFSTTFNTGMVCASPGRYYIHEKVYDEFIERFIAGLKKVVVGDPNDEKTDIGPVVSAEHRNKVESYIKAGIEEGAKLLLGGKRPTGPPLDKGFYIMPTVFADVVQDMKIAREEIFGPVVCFHKFSTDAQALEWANDSTYGLCGSVWTKDIARGMKLINQMQVGTTWINQHMNLVVEFP